MTIKVFSLKLLLSARQINQLSTGIQFRNKLARVIVLRYLVMLNAQVRIHRTISVTHLVKVSKIMLPVLKTIIFRNNTKVFPVQSNLTKTNKDFMLTAPETTPHPTQTQIRAAKWATQTKLHPQRSTHLTKVRSTIGWPSWSPHLSTKTVKSITQVILVASKMKMLSREDRLNHKLTNK